MRLCIIKHLIQELGEKIIPYWKTLSDARASKTVLHIALSSQFEIHRKSASDEWNDFKKAIYYIVERYMTIESKIPELKSYFGKASKGASAKIEHIIKF